MKITDNLKRNPVPIHIVACLQSHPRDVEGISSGECYYFTNYNYQIEEMRMIEEVVRIGKVSLATGEHDLIAIHYQHKKDPTIFLGHWNDGVAQ